MERRIGDRRVMWGFIARLIMEQILELSRAEAGGGEGEMQEEGVLSSLPTDWRYR